MLPTSYRRILSFSFLIVSAAVSLAQQPFHFDTQTKVFRIDAGASTYAFGVNESGGLQSLYWGGRLLDSDSLPAARSFSEYESFETVNGLTPHEFAAWGSGLYVEPALKITFPDGNRDLVLTYVSHTITADGITVLMKDISRDVFVTLRYTVDPETGVIGRSAAIENKTGGPFIVEQLAAGNLNLPQGTHYELNYLTGSWANEFNLRKREIEPGKTVLESRRGSTGQQNNPWFAIERSRSSDQDHGDVWFGALAWSGSWSISVEQDQISRVRVTAGYNPFDFGYKLEPGKTLQSPVLYAGFTPDGLGGASRLLHRFELTHVVPGSPKPRVRPVLYNSWEATTYHVDEAGQERLAEKAASIGVERFVMDDGWFGHRNDEKAGLGDWYPNPEKFPHGLKPLIDRVHSLGMDFGLWVEPEMVNPDSDLYRKHPDWVLNFTGRPRTENKSQLVLNLAREDVREYIFNVLDKLLSENDIAFLKWDYNRNWSEPGWPAVAPDEQKDIYVAATQNLYAIMRELRARHPSLEIEDCSGGGGRVDLGIMPFVNQFWTSDNTDPSDRLLIQDGFTQAYTPGVMMDWVTDSPSSYFITHRTSSLNFRFLSAMQGSLGIGANLNNWSAEEFASAKRYVADYKLIRETVQHGSLYRLISPQNNSPYSATESLSLDKSRAVLFTFLQSSHERHPYPTVQLRGLDPARTYTLRSLGKDGWTTAPDSASGNYWMKQGIQMHLAGDFQAAAFLLTANPR